jgi:hypothetical protein
MIVRALIWISTICFAIAFAMSWGDDGWPPPAAIVLICVAVAISIGFAVRKAFLALRELLSTRV